MLSPAAIVPLEYVKLSKTGKPLTLTMHALRFVLNDTKYFIPSIVSALGEEMLNNISKKVML